MHQADTQQRSDAKELLNVARAERAEYIKLYTRLQSNLTLFVDRSNHELAALALTITQKEQDIKTLEKMSDGYMVVPEPPAIKDGQPMPSAPATKDGAEPKPNGVVAKAEETS